MSIQERLQDDLKTAMRARDHVRTEVIRTMRAALQSAQLEADKHRYDAARKALEARGLSDRAEDADEQGLTPLAHALAAMRMESAPLTEADQEVVLAREVKRRREASEMYRQAGHLDRAEAEEAEARILEAYLPQQLSADELRPQVAVIIAELGLSGPAAMGKLMPVLVARFKGRADGRLLNQVARELLAQG